MKNECCKKPIILATLAVAVFVWALDFLIHGNLLKPFYEATASMWRPEPEMMSMMWACIAYHVVMAFVFTNFYFCWRSKTTCSATDGTQYSSKRSLCFGAIIGLLVGIPQLMAYVWLPFENAALPIAWAASEFVKWTLAGVLLSKLYRPTE
jgi:hypothetical protein